MSKTLSNYWDKKWEKAIFLEENNFANEVINFLWNKNWKLLDLWSGNWRDSIYFASLWLEVDSFDFSTKWLEILDLYAKERGLNINAIQWDTINYDFPKKYYDIIYACNSLHYFSKNETKLIFEKLKKSLKQDWYIFIRVKSINDVSYWIWDKIEDNYYKNWEELKYFFDIEFMKSLFSDFEIIKLWETKTQHIDWNRNYYDTYFIDFIARKI